MDQERKEEIIKLYGEPFMQTKSGGVKLNKLCLSELFNASVVIRYIKPKYGINWIMMMILTIGL